MSAEEPLCAPQCNELLVTSYHIFTFWLENFLFYLSVIVETNEVIDQKE